MPYTFLNLKDEVKGKLFPNGVAENLAQSVDGYFTEALIDLQRWVDCMKDQQFNVYPQCATFFKCGLTVFDAPRGDIKRIITVGSGWCCPVQYHQCSMEELRGWSSRFASFATDPANAGMPVLPFGIKYPEHTTDDIGGRAMVGKWAIDKGKIYLAPWIQSYEKIIIEWEGIKRSYADDDLVSNDADFTRAVRNFVKAQYAGDFESDGGKKGDALIDYAKDRADLMYDCREETRVRRCSVDQAVVKNLFDNCTDTEAPVTPGGTDIVYPVFGVIGDYGWAGQAESDVATLVKSWKPIGIITTGDNNYDDGAAATIAANIGAYYDTDILHVVAGNHDLDTVVSGVAGKPLKDYLGLSEFFYDFVLGGIHFFMLDSGENTAGTLVQPAGNNAMSQQAQWFQMALARSTAKWKVGVFHKPIYTNSTTYSPGFATFRWASLAGLDLILQGHGHNYERLEVNGQPQIVNGAGGKDLVGFIGSPTADSKVRFSSDFGACRLTNLCDKLRLEFITRAGVLVDTLEIPA